MIAARLWFGLMLVSTAATATGSFEPVNVKLFEAGKNGQYAMIVQRIAPTASYSEANSASTLLSLCKELRIFGGLDQQHWQLRPEVTVAAHMQSMALLQRAYQTKTAAHFGPLGDGFCVANKTAPCTDKSRGLVFWRDATADAALSVYQAF